MWTSANPICIDPKTKENIGRNQVCIQCSLLPTKPTVEQFELEDLVNTVQLLAAEHEAGWKVDFDSLDYVTAQTLVFYLNCSKNYRESIMLSSIGMF